MESTEKVYHCKYTDVVVLSRQRKKMNEKRLKELCGSIEKHGQLEPGVCRLDKEGSPVLIIGERRLKACEHLGINFSYTLKEDIEDEVVLRELEFTENFYRENLSWQDKVESILGLHELWQEQRGIAKAGSRDGHSIRDTAKELHISVGATQEAIEVGMFAREFTEVRKATHLTVAKNIVKRYKEDIRREQALDEALEGAYEKKDALRRGTTKTGFQGLSPTETRIAEKIQEVEGEESYPDEAGVLSREEAELLEYDGRCLLGPLETVSKSLEPESFDVIIFDPPWGVQHDKVAIKSGKAQHFDDSKERFDERFEGWLRIIYGLMKPDSHLYVVFGIVNHEKVYRALEDLRTPSQTMKGDPAWGFTVNRMPIFWKKKGAHHTRSPKVWPGRCYEAIAYARKGSKDLVKEGWPDIVETSMPTSKMKDSHPNAKHPDIYRDLLRRSCDPGDNVLDPMSGSGMFGVACESLRTELALNWLQIEEDEDFRNLGIINLVKGYGEVLGGGGIEPQTGEESSSGPGERTSNLVTTEMDELGPASMPERAVPPLPSDFKELEPGTPEWSRYWKEHPEQHEAMLEWRKEQ